MTRTLHCHNPTLKPGRVFFASVNTADRLSGLSAVLAMSRAGERCRLWDGVRADLTWQRRLMASCH